jgi:hypothetical protein
VQRGKNCWGKFIVRSFFDDTLRKKTLLNNAFLSSHYKFFSITSTIIGTIKRERERRLNLSLFNANQTLKLIKNSIQAFS